MFATTTKTSRTFEAMEIEAAVFLPGTKQHLEIDNQGLIAIPNNVKPQGFKLSLLVPQNRGIFLAQKEIQVEQGGYHMAVRNSGNDGDFTRYVTAQPVDVMRAGPNVWTAWHVKNPNRVDCWQLFKNGEFNLFQIGVITHDDGRTWRLHGEYRWKGQLFQGPSGIVGKPEDPTWGWFNVRKDILDYPAFKNLAKNVQLRRWEGTPEELEPALPKAPRPGYAVMQWYVPFAGQTGQGPVVLHPDDWDRWCRTIDHNPQNALPDKDFVAWVHGCDILELQPDDDGVKRLDRGDVVRFEYFHQFGAKKHRLQPGQPPAPPKLIGVTKVS